MSDGGVELGSEVYGLCCCHVGRVVSGRGCHCRQGFSMLDGVECMCKVVLSLCLIRLVVLV